MNSYTFEQIRRDTDTGYFDLMQKTVVQGRILSTVPYTVQPEQQCRMDRLSFDGYNSIGFIEEIMTVNGILNPFTIKTGDIVNMFQMEDLSQLQWTEPEKNPNVTSLSNPNKNTQKDTNRLSPTDNPGIKPVVLDTKAKKIKIMNKLS